MCNPGSDDVVDEGYSFYRLLMFISRTVGAAASHLLILGLFIGHRHLFLAAVLPLCIQRSTVSVRRAWCGDARFSSPEDAKKPFPVSTVYLSFDTPFDQRVVTFMGQSAVLAIVVYVALEDETFREGQSMGLQQWL